MTYGLCADAHFHAWSLFAAQTKDGINTRLESALAEFERLCKETHDRGGKRVYIAGDIFHVRGSIKPSVMNPVVSKMITMTDLYDLQIRLIPGNHDLEGAEVTFAGNATVPLQHSTFDDAPEISIIQTPTFFEDDMVAMVPWHNTRQGLEDAILTLSKDIAAEGCSIDEVDLILHTGINGVIIGMPDHAWAPEHLASFGFKRVFSGHYHQHKVFEFPIPGTMSETTQVVSIGALTHQTWGDVGTTAGWIIVNDKDFDQVEAKTPKFLDFSDDYEVEDYAGNYVRVRGIELEETEIRELKDALETAGAKGVVVHAVAKSKVTTRSGKPAGKSVKMEESINDWITANEEIDEKDRKNISIAALDVLSLARSL